MSPPNTQMCSWEPVIIRVKGEIILLRLLWLDKTVACWGTWIFSLQNMCCVFTTIEICNSFRYFPDSSATTTMIGSLLLVSVCLGMLASSAALPHTLQVQQEPQDQQDQQVPLHSQLRSYLVSKLANFTEEQKLSFARKLWNYIHCQRVRMTKRESLRKPRPFIL